MKPYYSRRPTTSARRKAPSGKRCDDAVTIYHADCMDVLPTLSDLGMVLGAGYGEHDDAMPHDEYVAWQHSVLTACWNALADDGAIYYQHKPRVKDLGVILPLELNPGLPLRQIITWDRGSGFMRQFSCYVPRYEWIMLLAKPAFRITTRDVDDLWRIPPVSGSDHPAPFPLALATKAIGTTSAEVIVDPFMGSGTTLRAAKDLRRKAIGIERNERFCEMAAKRMGQEVLDFGGAA